jgi:AcrR family transcriptional regulator
MNERSFIFYFVAAMPPKRSAPHAAASDAPPTKGEATRAALLAAAHKLFLQQGFHGTSMRQIADEAGLAVGGIYNHFATKEDIFAAVLDAYHPYHVLLPALEQTEGENVEALVRSAAEQVRQGIAGSETRLLPLVFMDLVEFRGQHMGRLARKLMPQFLPFFQRFTQLPGRLRPLPLPVVFRALLSLMVGYLITEMILRNARLSTPLGMTPREAFDGLIDIYLHGILDERKAD